MQKQIKFGNGKNWPDVEADPVLVPVTDYVNYTHKVARKPAKEMRVARRYSIGGAPPHPKSATPVIRAQLVASSRLWLIRLMERVQVIIMLNGMLTGLADKEGTLFEWVCKAHELEQTIIHKAQRVGHTILWLFHLFLQSPATF